FTDALRSELLHDHSRVHVTMVQMPALNTPQFDWARNKMPRRPQPVPPIFEPEVAAEAIVFAAHARRREVFVGGSTVAAIIANRLAPGLLDRYLARNGYRGQLTQEANPGGPDNLFAPVAGDRGAHGRFDALAQRKSAEFWMVRHRGLLAAGLVALVATLLTGWPSRVAARARSR
ncbi:MAG TPA: short-chain dehydrogenase, partial [Stellaceae bacterium]